MEINAMSKLKMLFRLYVAKYWITHKAITKFKFTLLVLKIDEIILA